MMKTWKFVNGREILNPSTNSSLSSDNAARLRFKRNFALAGNWIRNTPMDTSVCDTDYQRTSRVRMNDAYEENKLNLDM